MTTESKDCRHEISVKSYVNDAHHDGKICFVSCFNDGDAMKTAKLISNCEGMPEAVRVFSSKTLSGEFRNCIIDAIGTNIIPPIGSSVVSSVRAAVEKESLRKIFPQTLWDSVEVKSRLIRVQGCGKTLCE
jgi:hypothetical protein